MTFPFERMSERGRWERRERERKKGAETDRGGEKEELTAAAAAVNTMSDSNT